MLRSLSFGTNKADIQSFVNYTTQFNRKPQPFCELNKVRALREKKRERQRERKREKEREMCL